MRNDSKKEKILKKYFRDRLNQMTLHSQYDRHNNCANVFFTEKMQRCILRREMEEFLSGWIARNE